jgi:hypothetical protein
MATPHERFWRREQPLEAAAELPLQASAVTPERPGKGEAWVARRVGANAVISLSWQQFSVGKHHDGARVDVHVGPGRRRPAPRRRSTRLLPSDRLRRRVDRPGRG